LKLVSKTFLSRCPSLVISSHRMSRVKDVYFAKLAEQAERYDEMANYMESVGKVQV